MIEAETHPFAEILRPFVDAADAEVEAFAERHPWLAGAIPGLREQLLGRLCSIAGVPLYLWFRANQEGRGHEGGDADSVEVFRAAMTSGDGPRSWVGFCGEYPELARLLALVVAQWRAFSVEFMERMVADRGALAEFLRMRDLEVEAVDAGWSDPHGGGRSVVRVTFCGGRRVAYKPRPLEAEAVWARLVEEIAGDDPSLQVPHAAVLSRPTHGWMEWLVPSTCSDSGAWYMAAGRLECLLLSLGAADAHMANCIATADGPVLIDCECLLTPRARGRAPDEGIDALLSRIQQTAFLPDARRRVGDPELSGLFGGGGQSTGYWIPVWSREASGAVQLAFAPAVLRAQANLLPHGSEAIPRMAACEAFLNGFAAMYRYLADHSAKALSILAPLGKKPTRVLLRSTRRYTHILSRSIHPRFLRNREERRQVITSLLEAEPLPVPSDAAAGVVKAEIEALERLDVPFFHAEGLDLIGEGRLLESEFFSSSGYDEAESGLRGVAEEELSQTLSALRLLWVMSL